MNATGTLTAEFRSCVTFECKTTMAAPIEISDTHKKEPEPAMTQHQQQQQQQSPGVTTEKRPSEQVLKVEQSNEIVDSPTSSPGTSVASSPALPTECASINSCVASSNFRMNESNMCDPLSDDSESMPNDLSVYHGEQEEMSSPLAQLQCALGKNGMLGKKLNLPHYPSPDSDVLSRESERNGIMYCNVDHNHHQDGCGEIYKCHLCSYSGNSKFHYNTHMNTHFDHKCPFCDYTSRTEGRLKRHVKDFHSETPPDSWAGTRVPHVEGNGSDFSMDESMVTTGNGKARQYRCKQCSFVALSKNDFWEHNKTHIKAEKLLTCPQCPFVTEYKHHLEYHLRNHYGSKPFKCAKCNYSCVNKSMLNSHMKSHSNIYQYRCADCTYATKYCHSLKLHLRKYGHKPASVLNMDGTPNPYPVIDIYGTRRGPRPKKSKHGHCDDPSNVSAVTSTALVVSQPTSYTNMPPLIPSHLNMPLLYPPQFMNGYHNGIFARPRPEMESSDSVYSQRNTHLALKQNSSNLMKCILCEFTTEFPELFNKHMLMHATSDNQDLIKLYGINSESILQLHEHKLAITNYIQNHKHLKDNGFYALEPEVPFKNYESAKIEENSHNPLTNQSISMALVKNGFHTQDRDSPSENGKSPPIASPENMSLPQLSIPSFSPRYHSFQKSAEGITSESGQSVIVSHKTVISHSSPSSQQSSTSSGSPSLEKMQEQSVETSPLDLSGCRSNDKQPPYLQMEINESSTEAKDDVAEISTSTVTSAASNTLATTTLSNANSSQSQPRNRRKGKAFKLDQIYLQYEDHSPPHDAFAMESSPESGEIESFDCHEGLKNSHAVKTVDNIPANKASLPHLGNLSSIQQQQRKSPMFLCTDVPTTQNATVPAENAPSTRPLDSAVSSTKHTDSNSLLKSASSEASIKSVNRSPVRSEDSGGSIKSAEQEQKDLSNSTSALLPQQQVSFIPTINGFSLTHKKNAIIHSRSYPNFPTNTASLAALECHLSGPMTEFNSQNTVPKMEQGLASAKQLSGMWQDAYTCGYCDIAFRDCVLYTMHMGYHGYRDPFTCNMCGQQSKDKVAFFLHIARAAHL